MLVIVVGTLILELIKLFSQPENIPDDWSEKLDSKDFAANKFDAQDQDTAGGVNVKVEAIPNDSVNTFDADSRYLGPWWNRQLQVVVVCLCIVKESWSRRMWMI